MLSWFSHLYAANRSKRAGKCEIIPPNGAYNCFSILKTGRNVTLFIEPRECVLFDTHPAIDTHPALTRKWPTQNNTLHIQFVSALFDYAVTRSRCFLQIVSV